MNARMQLGYKFARKEIEAGRIADLRHKVEEASDFGDYDDFDRGAEVALKEFDTLRTQLTTPPRVGSRWRRTSEYDAAKGPYNGYTVLFITNTAHSHPSHPPQVVYEGDNGHKWSVDLDRWPGSLTPE